MWRREDQHKQQGTNPVLAAVIQSLRDQAFCKTKDNWDIDWADSEEGDGTWWRDGIGWMDWDDWQDAP